MKDDTTTLLQLKKIIHEFRSKRGWVKEDPKDLALSLVLESSELLEHFQWLTGKEVLKNDKIKQAIGEEMSDVLWWLLDLSDRLELDMAEIFEKKMQKNAQKYPEELFGTHVSQEEKDRAYYKIKAATRGGHPLYDSENELDEDETEEV